MRELRGELCFAPPDGQTVRFTRPDRWLEPPPEPLAGREEIGEIARRFLAAYGPSTREHLARWSGTSPPAQAGRWLRARGYRPPGRQA